jgi:hypothetical protein
VLRLRFINDSTATTGGKPTRACDRTEPPLPNTGRSPVASQQNPLLLRFHASGHTRNQAALLGVWIHASQTHLDLPGESIAIVPR